MALKFQTSVADVVLRDPVTHIAIAHGKSNINTSLKQTMAKTEARGGIGNPLLYSYFHDRAVSISIEMPVFNEYILALQSGADVATGNLSCVATDCVVLSSGSGVLAHTPTGDVTFIFDDNDAAVSVTPSGSAINGVTGGLNRKGVAIYDYLTTSDRITVTGSEQPSTVELILTARVYDASHTDVVQYFQVNVPQFKVDGNYTLNMAANAVSNQSLNGDALLNTATDCSSGDYFYTATYINVDLTTSPYTLIAATPSPMSFSAASGSPASGQITVTGYRSGLHTSTGITSSCVFTKTSGCACFSVSAGGLVTSGSPHVAATYEALINVAYWDASSGSLTDVVRVVGIA